MVTPEDLKQFENHGISEEKVKGQLGVFKRGAPYALIITAATQGNGVDVIDPIEQKKLIDLYDTQKKQKDIIKFVPASGAATRMFSFLHAFLEDYNPEEEILKEYLKRQDSNDLAIFFSKLKEFPFLLKVRKKIRKKYPTYKTSTKGERMQMFVHTLLDPDGLNFSELPKGLVPFHKYVKVNKTAFEEQLFEATQYASSQSIAHVHFTFSPNHLELYKSEFNRIEKRLKTKTKTEIKISYSFQDKSTDTIAVTPDNLPYRNEDGTCLFRPSGHGALLKNLNVIDADIIFIKNIDNVTIEANIRPNSQMKKMLAGRLLQVQSKIFQYIKLIVSRTATASKLQEMRAFLFKELNIKDVPETEAGIATILNKPLRVCGVVKNTGAPGGGPFWVKNRYGEITLQIVEMSQINKEDERQWSIAQEATHFNPVDIVCGTRNYLDKSFDLNHFADNTACFISDKTVNGEAIKALELPGLWNGGMALWNTIFVEVPSATFSPVKTVNDLLDPAHKPLA